ncbi:MAG: efflux RND transporter permease subunit [Treponema sp.]|nr:efflux RND transporter permease subunit [Treponema sp.]
MKAFESKKKAFFVLAALSILSVYSLKNLKITCQPASAKEYFSVHIDWFGIDAEKIERMIAIPLEEQIHQMEKLIDFSTACEYSRCVVNLTFLKGKESAFFALSDILEKFSHRLPSDAQKPRIYANASDEKWVITAAFEAKKHSRKDIEKKLKNALQNIPGASQVVFLGGETEEIHLTFNDKVLSSKNETPWSLASCLQEENASELFGKNMSYCNRCDSLWQINKNHKTAPFAFAKIGFKEKDSYARINGKECVLACVKSSSGSQNIKISKMAKKILKKQFPNENDWKITFDNGKEQERALLKILNAFFLSVVALTLTVLLFYRSVKNALLLLIFTSLDLLFTLAAISVLKIPLDSATISGMTISLGLICDAALYMTDDCTPSISAMAISTLTSVCALLPLFALETFSPGIKNLSVASALTISLSAILAIFFLPIFFKRERNNGNGKIILSMSTFIDKMPRNVIRVSYFLYILTFVFIFFSPKKLKTPEESQYLTAQVEWPCEKSAESIDKELQAFIPNALQIEGVELLQTEAKKSCAEINVVLKNPRKKNYVAKQMVKASSSLTGSLYIPLCSPKNEIAQSIHISVLGKENDICRSICKEAAKELMKHDYFLKKKSQSIFHFKEEEKIFIAKLDKNILAKNNISCQELAYFLRWNLFGAVAQKKRSENFVQDIRIGNINCPFGRANLKDLSKLQMKGIAANALFSLNSEKRPQKIFRQNGSRAASWTLEIETKKSVEAFKEVKKALGKMQLPEGYFFSFPKELEELNKNYAFILFAFALSIFITYCLIAGQCERLSDAFKAILTIPLSIFLPLFIRFASRTPLNTSDVVAMVFISGICVNNALYILNEWNLRKRKDAFLAAKNLLKSLLSSTGTSMAAALPVIFNAGGSFAGDLAFFTFFGSLGSLASSLFIFPLMLEKKGAPPECEAPKRKRFWKRLIWPRLPCSEELSS